MENNAKNIKQWVEHLATLERDEILEYEPRSCFWANSESPYLPAKNADGICYDIVEPIRNSISCDTWHGTYGDKDGKSLISYVQVQPRCLPPGHGYTLYFHYNIRTRRWHFVAKIGQIAQHDGVYDGSGVPDLKITPSQMAKEYNWDIRKVNKKIIKMYNAAAAKNARKMAKGIKKCDIDGARKELQALAAKMRAVSRKYGVKVCKFNDDDPRCFGDRILVVPASCVLDLDYSDRTKAYRNYVFKDADVLDIGLDTIGYHETVIRTSR